MWCKSVNGGMTLMWSVDFQGERGRGSEGRRPQGDDPGRVEGYAEQRAGEGGVQHPQTERRRRGPVEERIRAAQVQEQRLGRE